MGAWLKFGAVVALAVELAACGGGAPRIYPLDPVVSAAVFARRASVRVRLPKTIAALDGDRIVQRNAGADLALLPDIALGGRLPEVVADRIVATLRKARLRAFGEGETADVDFDLQLAIKDFGFDATRRTVSVTIAAKLVALANGRVIASKTFSDSAAAPSADPEAVFAALAATFAKTLTAMTVFVGASLY